MAAGIEAPRTFFSRACLRALCGPRLTILYFSCGTQACDLMAEAVCLNGTTGNLVDTSKSSLRRARRSRVTATDRCCVRPAGSPVCPALARACRRRLRAARTLAGAAVRRGWTYQSPGRTARAQRVLDMCTVVPCPPG